MLTHQHPHRPRLLGLDLIRGICAIAVMVYHYCGYAKWGSLYPMGTFGVYIFFVLSGFALYYVYGQKAVDEDMLRGFFISRFLRIMPLFLAVATYRVWGEPLDAHNFVRLAVYATPLMGIADVWSFSRVVIGGWSILIEWSFYLLFPLLMLFRSIRVLAAIFIVTMIINYNYMIASFFPPDHVRQGQEIPYLDTLAFLCFFVGGMLMGKVYLEVPAVAKLSARIPAPLLWSLVGVGLIFSFPLFLPFNGRVDYLTGVDATAIILLAILAVFLSALQQPTGAVASISKFLGDISFSLYLLHPYVWSHIGKLAGPPGWLQFALSVPLTVVLSYLVYSYFEKPARDIRDWWPRRYRLG